MLSTLPHSEDDLKTVFASRFGPIFTLLDQFQSGLPDDPFLINMGTGSIETLPFLND
ncbi:MAG: hypothetical protein ACI8R9_002347 [Paraglaciecola sp.]